MAIINLTTVQDALGGSTPVSSTVTAIATRGDVSIPRVSGSAITFPQEVKIQIINGVPQGTFNLVSLPANYYWKLDVFHAGHAPYRLNVVVPSGAGPFNFSELIIVDPATAIPDAAANISATYLAQVQASADRAEISSRSAAASAATATGAVSNVIISGSVVSGNLILSKLSGATVNAGSVVGPQGAQGPQGATGTSGVIAVTAPITNSGTSTSAQLGLDGTIPRLTASQTFTGTQLLVSNSATAPALRVKVTNSEANSQEWAYGDTTLAFVNIFGQATFPKITVTGSQPTAFNGPVSAVGVPDGNGGGAALRVYAIDDINYGQAPALSVYDTTNTTVVADISGLGNITGTSFTKSGGTSREVLKANGTANVLTAGDMASLYVPWIAGSSYRPVNATGSGGQFSGGGQVMYWPLVVPNSVTLNQISTTCATATLAGTVRLGIYSETNGLPSTRILDAGLLSFTTTSSTTYSITISQALAPGRYWIAFSLASGTGNFTGAPNGNSNTSVLTSEIINNSQPVLCYQGSNSGTSAMPTSPGTLASRNFGNTGFVRVGTVG